MISLAFFNNKGGVGKTALVSHLAWMYAELGVRTLAVDLDPQSNLTSMFVEDDRLVELWSGEQTVRAALRPLIDRSGDVAPAHVESVANNLHLVAGDLGLSRYEDLLAENWGKCLMGEPGAFRVMSAFHRILNEAAARVDASIVLVDLGPNLGPLNRAALLASDNLAIPIAPDLFSLQGMQNLGPTLRDWRSGWRKRLDELVDRKVPVPQGAMNPIGYVLISFGTRGQRPVKAYDNWITHVPRVFREAVLGEQQGATPPTLEEDPYRLAALKHYRSLMPLAMAARKPMFLLRPADGARGAHQDAVQTCFGDFRDLARTIGAKLGLPIP